jgi:hypothetical protein
MPSPHECIVKRSVCHDDAQSHSCTAALHLALSSSRRYYGFPPLKTAGSILRRQVAELCVEALVQPAAANKVVEAIAEVDMPPRDAAELFSSVRI